MTTLARESLAAVAALVYRPRSRQRPSEWAGQHRQMIPGQESAPGPWRTDSVPYLRGVMDVCGESGITRVSVRKGGQTGVTSAMINVLFQRIDDDPGPTLWVYPSEQDAVDVNRDRLFPTMQATPRIAALLTDRRHDAGNLRVRLRNGMILRFAGSNAKSRLEKFPYRTIFVDELDRCRPASVSGLDVRTTAFEQLGALFVAWGTPSLEGVGVDAQYARSDRRRYWVPCPSCLAYHVRDWRQVRWEGSVGRGLEGADRAGFIDRVRRTAWHVCPSCNAKVHAHSNLWQLRRGVWLRDELDRIDMDPPRAKPGEPIEIAPAFAGRDPRRAPRVVRDPMRSSHAGFDIPGLYAVSGVANPYGRLAAKFVELGGSPDAEWVTDMLGQAWRERGDAVSAYMLRKACTPESAGGYKMGTVPAGAVLLTLAADVQQDRAWLMVTAWGERGAWRALVSAEFVATRQLDKLEPLRAHLLRTWPTAGNWAAQRWALPGGRMPILWTMLDSGHRAKETYAFARAMRKDHQAVVRVVKGTYKPADLRTHWESVVDHAEQVAVLDGGRRVVKKLGGLEMLIVNTHHHKSGVLGLLAGSGGSLAGEALDSSAPLDGADYEGVDGAFVPYRFPEDTPDWVFDQLTSEERVRKVLPGGRVEHRWRRKHGQPDNHLFDLAVYQEAGTQALGVDQISEAVADVTLAPIYRRFVHAFSPPSGGAGAATASAAGTTTTPADPPAAPPRPRRSSGMAAAQDEYRRRFSGRDD